MCFFLIIASSLWQGSLSFSPSLSLSLCVSLFPLSLFLSLSLFLPLSLFHSLSASLSLSPSPSFPLPISFSPSLPLFLPLSVYLSLSLSGCRLLRDEILCLCLYSRQMVICLREGVLSCLREGVFISCQLPADQRLHCFVEAVEVVDAGISRNINCTPLFCLWTTVYGRWCYFNHR